MSIFRAGIISARNLLPASALRPLLHVYGVGESAALRRVRPSRRHRGWQLPGPRRDRGAAWWLTLRRRAGVCGCAAAGEEEAPDEPDLALGKAKELNKEVELEETEIKKVAADEATPYSSAATFEELNLTPELLQVCVCVCVCVLWVGVGVDACGGRVPTRPPRLPHPGGAPPAAAAPLSILRKLTGADTGGCGTSGNEKRRR